MSAHQCITPKVQSALYCHPEVVHVDLLENTENFRIVQREQDKALKQNALNTDNRLMSGFKNTNSRKNVQ
jgi:hypothetical protein